MTSGVDAPLFERVDHELEPWAKRCHTLADMLDYYEIIHTEEKRRVVGSLGSDIVNHLGHYERWTTVFANILFEEGILGPAEPASKMVEAQTCYTAESKGL